MLLAPPQPLWELGLASCVGASLTHGVSLAVLRALLSGRGSEAGVSASAGLPVTAAWSEVIVRVGALARGEGRLRLWLPIGDLFKSNLLQNPNKYSRMNIN